MGLLDSVLGRGKAAPPDLEGLRSLPAAAATLRAAGLRPTGVGTICVKPVDGGTIDGSEKFVKTTDEYGYTWLTCRTSPDDISRLVDDLHELGVAGDDAGFGPALLCALVTFSDGRTPNIGLVYRYKRGAWYPFAPTGIEQRDNARELELRSKLADDLKIERDLTLWAPVWGAPGLSPAP